MVKAGIVLGIMMFSLLVTATDGGFGGEPACSDVWVVGEKLSEDYEGCDEGPALEPGSRTAECADGSRIEAYHAFWARPGDSINDANLPDGRSKLMAALTQCAPPA